MAGRLPVGITCFAKWTDNTWYNVKILAKNEASYTVTYIDYGNSENFIILFPQRVENDVFFTGR